MIKILQSSTDQRSSQESSAQQTAQASHTINNDGQNHARIDRMGSEPIGKLLVEFSIPAILGLLVTSLYTFIDGIFIGQGVGDVGIAATTVCYPMVIIMMALSLLLGNGGNSLAALRLGEGKHEEAEKILGNTVTLLLIAAVLILAIGLPLIKPILYLSGATDESYAPARLYLAILMCGFLTQGFTAGVGNFIRTAGSPNWATGIMLIGAIINVVLDYFFVLVFNWGMAGAASATIIGQGVSSIITIGFFLRNKSPLRLRWRHLRLAPKLVKGICILGFASFIMQAAMALSNLVLNNLFVKYGGAETIGSTGALAAMGAIERVSQVFFLPIIGVAIAAQPIIGYNYGAQNFARVRKSFWQAVIGGTLVVSVFWAVCELLPHPLLALFNLTEVTMPFATWSLRVYMLFVPILAFQVIGSNYFQSTGQAFKASILVLLRQVICMIFFMVTSPLVLPLFFDVTQTQSIMIGIAINDVVSTIVTALFVIPEMRRLNRRIVSQQPHEPLLQEPALQED